MTFTSWEGQFNLKKYLNINPRISTYWFSFPTHRDVILSLGITIWILHMRHRMEKRFYLSLCIVPAKSQIEKSPLDYTYLSILIHSCFPHRLLYLMSSVCFSWQSQIQHYVCLCTIFQLIKKWKLTPCCHNTTQNLICYTLASITTLLILAECQDNLWDI